MADELVAGRAEEFGRRAMTPPVSVLVAEDDKAMRTALAEVVTAADELALVAVAEDAQQAVELAAARRPDVALVDVRMPHGGGVRAATEIRRVSPRTRLLAFTGHEDSRNVEEMLAAGANGYLVKGAAVDEIVAAILQTAAGQSTLSSRVAGHVVRALGTRLELERTEAEWARRWEERIRRLLAGKEQYELAFQPIADLLTGSIIGFEALSRFAAEPQHDPALWFSEARTIGLGTALDLLVLRYALQRIERLPDELFLTVNVSPDLLLTSESTDLLSEVDGGRVVLEITEHAEVSDYGALRPALARVRKHHTRIAVDDAGAGYASLRHILRLEPDLIKLDMSLVRGIDRDRPQRALATAMVAFANEIGATVIAEGIETAAELETLRGLGVGLGQGYLLGRPVCPPAKDGGSSPSPTDVLIRRLIL